MMVLLVIGGFFLLALSYLTYKSMVSKILKSVCMLIFTTVAVIAYEHYIAVLGEPVQAYPLHDFLYVHHVITGDSQILLWASEPTTNKNRLYSFPYDRETAKKLSGIENQSEETKQTSMKFEKTPDGFVLSEGEWRGETVSRHREK